MAEATAEADPALAAKDVQKRRLTVPVYDGAGAVISTTTHLIDQLAYHDGVTPFQVLEDLMALEPAYYWAAFQVIGEAEPVFVSQGR